MATFEYPKQSTPVPVKSAPIPSGVVVEFPLSTTLPILCILEYKAPSASTCKADNSLSVSTRVAKVSFLTTPASLTTDVASE